jgi:hypothetical protein
MEKFGEGFVARHIEAATGTLDMLKQHTISDATWKVIERDLVGAGFGKAEALTSALVSAAAGYLAVAHGLDGECVGCAAQPLLDRRVLRPQDMPALYAALDCAATLAVGLLREVNCPDGVRQASWMRGSYAAARITHDWVVAYPAAA